MKTCQKRIENLEEIISLSNYVVRYEKGNFQSGWCLLEHQKVVILNKFLQLNDRVTMLEELIPELKIESEKLPTHLQELYFQVKSLYNQLFSES